MIFPAHRTNGFACPLTTRAIEAGNIRAGFGQGQRHALSQSLPCAGDEGNFPIEFE